MRSIIGFILLISMVLSLFTMCKDKSDSKPSYSLSGYIYNDCGTQPSANLKIDLYQEIAVGLSSSSGGVLASTTTDGNGYFKIEYKDVST